MAVTFALAIDQGATLSQEITITGKDFTGATGKCQIRRRASLDSAVVAEPTVTLSGATITLDLSATETGAINLSSTVTTVPDVLYYDVFVTEAAPSTVVTKELTGTVSILPSITRA